MQISITSGLLSSERSGRRVSSSAEAYSPGLELIDRPEIHIARHQYLDARAVAHPDSRRDVDSAAQNVSEHVLRCRGIENDRAAARGRLHFGLHDTVDRGDQRSRSEALPEVAAHFALESRAPE